MTSRVCLVTGANTGIGLEITKGLAQTGALVVMACRDLNRGEAARAEVVRATKSDSVHLLPLDLASLASIRAFAETFDMQFKRLDTLVSNAGVLPGRRRVTTDGFEEAFAVNFLGPFLLVDQLLPMLRLSSEPRLIFMGGAAERSGKIAWEDLQSSKHFTPMAALAQSRLALMLFMRELARRSPDMAINVVDPGATRTSVLKEMPGFVRFLSLFFKNPTAAARTPIWLATARESAHITGRYFKSMREISSSAAARDDAQAHRLWETATELLASHR